MKRHPFKHGFGEVAWEAAKEEARQLMYNAARKKSLISYSELVTRITQVQMEAHDPRLDHFLGEIAHEDDEAGLGLSTVVVVHKTGDQMPGPGFFEMAEEQGRDVSDPVACWMSELNSVYDHWG